MWICLGVRDDPADSLTGTGLGLGQTQGHWESKWRGFYLRILPVGAPALLYLLQTLIMVDSMGCIDWSTFAILMQSKIAWAFVLSIIMLGAPATSRKVMGVVSIIVCIVGVNLWAQEWEEHRKAGVATRKQTCLKALDWVGIELSPMTRRLTATCFVALSAFFSGLAGVVTQTLLKGGSFGFFQRNAQLAVFSIVFLLGNNAGWFLDGSAMSGILQPVVFWVGVTMACCGMLWGLVIKRLDVVSKDMATATSIFINFFVSVFFADLEMPSRFIFLLYIGGMSGSVASIFLFNSKPPPSSEASESEADKRWQKRRVFVRWGVFLASVIGSYGRFAGHVERVHNAGIIVESADLPRVNLLLDKPKLKLKSRVKKEKDGKTVKGGAFYTEEKAAKKEKSAKMKKD